MLTLIILIINLKIEYKYHFSDILLRQFTII